MIYGIHFKSLIFIQVIMCVNISIVNTTFNSCYTHNYISTTVQLNQINYTDVTLSSNTSIQTPDHHSTVPYSKIVFEHQ